MPYIFPPQKEVTELNKWCLDIIHDVQYDLKDYFTFDIKLIGSGEKRLVTQNEDKCFDLDYNLIIQKDKKDLINNPKAIKQLFMQSFNEVLEDAVNGYKHVCDSTSVVTNKIVINNRLEFKFDVAILVKADNDKYYRLINDKNTGRYIWNELRGSKNYIERFSHVKHLGLFNDFKTRYLELKNMHLSRGEDIKSFSVLLETLNEFEQ